MAEKTRYSDAELEEFRAIILEKLEIAKRDYELLRSGVTNSDGNDVADTSPTFKVLDGFNQLDEEGLKKFIDENGLAMDLGDIKFCQEYFRSEQRDPTITEIKMTSRSRNMTS